MTAHPGHDAPGLKQVLQRPVVAVRTGADPLAPAAEGNVQAVSNERGRQACGGSSLAYPTQAELAPDATEDEWPGIRPLERGFVRIGVRGKIRQSRVLFAAFPSQWKKWQPTRLIFVPSPVLSVHSNQKQMLPKRQHASKREQRAAIVPFWKVTRVCIWNRVSG